MSEIQNSRDLTAGQESDPARPAQDAADDLADYGLTDTAITVPLPVWKSLLENIAVLARDHDALLSVVRRLLAAMRQVPPEGALLEDTLPDDARYSLKELRKFL